MCARPELQAWLDAYQHWSRYPGVTSPTPVHAKSCGLQAAAVNLSGIQA